MVTWCEISWKNDMKDKFRALLARKEGDQQIVTMTELSDADLMEGDVTVAVEHSTVNYKDGLALTGEAPIIRKFPLIPGIDLAGTVMRSKDPRFGAGDYVVVNGFGLGETHHGGYAERARIKGDWVIKLPETISTARAMAIGTAATLRCYACWRWKRKVLHQAEAMCWSPELLEGLARSLSHFSPSSAACVGIWLSVYEYTP